MSRRPALLALASVACGVSAVDCALLFVSTDPNVDHTTSVRLPSGAWVRVQIEYTPGRIVALLDGVTAIDVATGAGFTGEASVYLGLFSEDAFAIAANYDNVLVDTSF